LQVRAESFRSVMIEMVRCPEGPNTDSATGQRCETMAHGSAFIYRIDGKERLITARHNVTGRHWHTNEFIGRFSTSPTHLKVMLFKDPPDKWKFSLSEDDPRSEDRKWLLAQRLSVHASFMKDRNFSEEKEVRIVEINGEPDLYTPHRYGMVPRIFIPLPEGCIQSIRIGPTAHKDLKTRSLFDYVHAVRFKKQEGKPPNDAVVPDVYGSTIPFRDW
jgi:hypothetical protein